MYYSRFIFPFFPPVLVNAIARNHQQKLRRIGNEDYSQKKDTENQGISEIEINELENTTSDRVSEDKVSDNSNLETSHKSNMEWLQKLVKIATQIGAATILQEGYISQGAQ